MYVDKQLVYFYLNQILPFISMQFPHNFKDLTRLLQIFQ